MVFVAISFVIKIRGGVIRWIRTVFFGWIYLIELNHGDKKNEFNPVFTLVRIRYTQHF
jgi:hypothetical protein